MKINGFPSKIVAKTIQDVRRKVEKEKRLRVINEPPPSTENLLTNRIQTEEEVTPFICLPYKGTLGERILSKFRDKLSNIIPTNVKPRFAYTGKKLVLISGSRIQYLLSIKRTVFILSVWTIPLGMLAKLT